MRIGSILENQKIEKRIAITPEIAKKYISLGLEVSLSENYGVHLGIKDEEYTVKLKHGTPIASLYAMHEEKMDIKMHRVNEETLKSIVSARIPSVFFRKYYSGKNTRRK